MSENGSEANQRQNDAISETHLSHTAADEQRLLEYLDGQLPPDESRKVQNHLATCFECRNLAEQWEQLDIQLESDMHAPSLSPMFARKVLSAIDSEINQSDVAISRAKPLETEWSNAWAQYRGRFLWLQLPGALDKVGYVFAAALAVCFAWTFASRYLANWKPQLSALPQERILPFALGVTALIIAAGLAVSAKRPLSRFFASL
jgi:anti-sigma factor RsiW